MAITVRNGVDRHRSGFTAVCARRRVASPDTTADQLEELSRHVRERSRVHDCLANPVPIATAVEVV